MTVSYSTAEQIAAMAAANAATDGTKESTFLTTWQTALGTNPFLKLYRNGSVVWKGQISGTVPISAGVFAITSASQLSIYDASIGTGSWEWRVENNADAGVYFGVQTATSADTDILSLDGDLVASSDTVDIGTITLYPPSLDTVTPVAEQTGSVVSGSGITTLQVTLPSQPTQGNKILVPFSFYWGYRGYSTPADVGATLVVDPSNLSSLKANTDGSGTVSAENQLVRRINNTVGSGGGYLYSTVGDYVRYDPILGSWYIDHGGSCIYISNVAASTYVSNTTMEVITAARSTSYSSSSDSWYAPLMWCVGDGGAGVSFHLSSAARAFNRDGTDVYDSITYTNGNDAIFSLQHATGTVKGALDSSAYGAGASSGNTSDVSTPFAIAGPYHGSWLSYTGRLYGLIAKNAAFSSTERNFIIHYLSNKMKGVTAPPVPLITDSNGNAFTVVESTVDAANRLMTALAVCHTAGTAGSGTYTVTLNFYCPGQFAAAQALEFSGLRGSDSVDKQASATNDGTAGSLGVAAGTTSQATELAFAVYGLYNDDVNANMVVPTGYTDTGSLDTASTVLGFQTGYKVLTAVGSETATGTWDAGSAAGGSGGVLVTFRAGVNYDGVSGDPGGGGGGGGGGGSEPSNTALTTNSVYADMTQPNTHVYYGLQPTWDWYYGPRVGAGANPSPAYYDPRFISWGVIAAVVGNPPGANHNWRVAIYNLIHCCKRNGQWELRQNYTTSAEIWGANYINYGNNTSVPAQVYEGNGIDEVYLEDGGSGYHFYTTQTRPAVEPTGTQHRITLIRCSKVLIDPNGIDDRTAGQAGCIAGGDYWRYENAPWSEQLPGGSIQYNNNDFAIGRGTEVAHFPEKSWHTTHTMTSIAEIDEFVTWFNSLGI